MSVIFIILEVLSAMYLCHTNDLLLVWLQPIPKPTARPSVSPSKSPTIKPSTEVRFRIHLFLGLYFFHICIWLKPHTSYIHTANGQSNSISHYWTFNLAFKKPKQSTHCWGMCLHLSTNALLVHDTNYKWSSAFMIHIANTQSNDIADAWSISFALKEPYQTAHFSGMFQMLVAFIEFDLFSISDSCLSYIYSRRLIQQRSPHRVHQCCLQRVQAINRLLRYVCVSFCTLSHLYF